MHIPDGYLSPSTCAALYATATPFWYGALRKVKQAINSRGVPLLSLFSAFSFVIMMFNLPLPGGTTGHAIGIGIAAIVLGPWAAMLAISMALLIQAIFFGDGGITTFAANSFNMAIVGALVAYLVYRLIAGNAPLQSKRRVIAAGLAGYAAINAAALCAAIELGIQPMLFKDAGGAPLYAPYPLSIAVPAMLIGHLTFAGMAELILTAGVIAYLQNADAALLKTTAGNARDDNAGAIKNIRGGRAARVLWIGLALLMIGTPLGLLAAGGAWSEWSPQDLADPATRQHIIEVSGHQPLPAAPPQGLSRLAAIWSAPMPNYAPAFMQSAKLGYIMSAMMGAGLIILAIMLISWLLRIKRGAHLVAEKSANDVQNT